MDASYLTACLPSNLPLTSHGIPVLMHCSSLNQMYLFRAHYLFILKYAHLSRYIRMVIIWAKFIDVLFLLWKVYAMWFEFFSAWYEHVLSQFDTCLWRVFFFLPAHQGGYVNKGFIQFVHVYECVCIKFYDSVLFSWP